MEIVVCSCFVVYLYLLLFVTIICLVSLPNVQRVNLSLLKLVADVVTSKIYKRNCCNSEMRFSNNTMKCLHSTVYAIHIISLRNGRAKNAIVYRMH